MSRGVKKSLLFLAVLTVLLAPLSFFLYRSNQRLQNEGDVRSRRLNELMNIETITDEELEDLNARYLWSLSKYGKVRNLYLFSQSVKDALEEEELAVLRYSRRVRKDENYIEFTLSGNVENFFSFLKKFSQESQAFKIPFFTIDARDNGAQITFLIGFDRLNEELIPDLSLIEGGVWSGDSALKERMTAESLARIFYLPAPPAKVSAPPVVEIPEEEISTPPDRLRFQYVGKVGTREGVRFYMKELKSNRIITVPSNGWQLLEQTDTSIRFGYNESVYEVPLL